MFDVTAPSSLLAIEQLDSAVVKKRLLRVATLSTRSEDDAKDLVSNALVRVLDPDDVPWVPAACTFVKHMGRVMRQTWERQVRKAIVQQELLEGGFGREEYTPSPGPSADDELQRHRSVALWRTLLEAVLDEIGDKHPLTRQICELVARGIDEPSDQARILRCEVRAIYRARETLEYHANRHLEAWELAEKERMKDVQEEAAKEDEEVNP